MNNYAVVSKYYDNGKIDAVVFYLKTEREKFECFSLPNAATCDTYVEYFSTYKEAEDYQKECFEA